MEPDATKHAATADTVDATEYAAAARWTNAAEYADAAGQTDATKHADAAETADATEYAATTGKNATAGAFSGRKEAGRQIMYYFHDFDVCTDGSNFY